MTALTWTIIYLFLLLSGSGRGALEVGLDSDKDFSESDRWLIAYVATTLIFLPLWLMYAAGVFVAVTGYEGTMGWFTTWIILLTIGLGKMIYTSVTKHKYYRIVAMIFSLIALYNMGAFDKIANFW